MHKILSITAPTWNMEDVCSLLEGGNLKFRQFCADHNVYPPHRSMGMASFLRQVYNTVPVQTYRMQLQRSVQDVVVRKLREQRSADDALRQRQQDLFRQQQQQQQQQQQEEVAAYSGPSFSQPPLDASVPTIYEEDAIGSFQNVVHGAKVREMDMLSIEEFYTQIMDRKWPVPNRPSQQVRSTHRDDDDDDDDKTAQDEGLRNRGDDNDGGGSVETMNDSNNRVVGNDDDATTDNHGDNDKSREIKLKKKVRDAMDTYTERQRHRYQLAHTKLNDMKDTNNNQNNNNNNNNDEDSISLTLEDIARAPETVRSTPSPSKGGFGSGQSKSFSCSEATHETFMSTFSEHETDDGHSCVDTPNGVYPFVMDGNVSGLEMSVCADSQSKLDAEDLFRPKEKIIIETPSTSTGFGRRASPFAPVQSITTANVAVQDHDGDDYNDDDGEDDEGDADDDDDDDATTSTAQTGDPDARTELLILYPSSSGDTARSVVGETKPRPTIRSTVVGEEPKNLPRNEHREGYKLATNADRTDEGSNKQKMKFTMTENKKKKKNKKRSAGLNVSFNIPPDSETKLGNAGHQQPKRVFHHTPNQSRTTTVAVNTRSVPIVKRQLQKSKSAGMLDDRKRMLLLSRKSASSTLLQRSNTNRTAPTTKPVSNYKPLMRKAFPGRKHYDHDNNDRQIRARDRDRDRASPDHLLQRARAARELAKRHDGKPIQGAHMQP